MSTGGVRHSEHPDIILFPINTLSRLAEQCVLRCRADLSDTRLRTCMCCLLLCWVPALCKHGVRKHWFFKVSALRWVGACLLPVSCGSRVLPLCLLQCRVCFAAVSCSGLVRATKLVNRQRFPTPPSVYSNYSFAYNVLVLFGSTPSLPQVNLVHPHRVSLRHTDCSPSSHWHTHRGARTHDHKVKGLALYRLS